MKIILSCGAKKMAVKCPAYRMYVGSYFKAALEWAKTVAPPSDVYILSAKYGLIHCKEVIEPYDARMGTSSQVTTANEIMQQAQKLNLLDKDAIFCGGKDYQKILKTSLPKCRILWDFVKLKGGGMGYQIQWFKTNKGFYPKLERT